MRDKLRKAFDTQRRGALKRGIEFLLTWDEWLFIWEQSGHLSERGPRKGQYVMARFKDAGPYQVGNVSIVTATENNTGKILSIESRLRIGAGMLGITRSDETRLRMSVAKCGNQYARKSPRPD